MKSAANAQNSDARRQATPPRAMIDRVDYRFLGTDFHDRCRIARKIKRWQRKLAALPSLERAAVIAGLDATRAP